MRLDNFTTSLLAIASAVAWLALVLISPCSSWAGKLQCWPERVYRGGTFTVDLPEEHEDYDFAIRRGLRDTFLISFKPDRYDRIGPVISAKDFAAMRQITLSTRTARGSLSEPYKFGRSRTLRDPQKIFKGSAPYLVLLGRDLDDGEADFDACWIDYYDYPEPKGAGPAEPR